MKSTPLKSEPSEGDINALLNITEQSSIELLIRLRNCCKLNKTQAAQLLQIDRKTLRSYENLVKDMLQRNYCKYLSIYYLYAQNNGLLLPQEIEQICQFFVHSPT